MRLFWKTIGFVVLTAALSAQVATAATTCCSASASCVSAPAEEAPDNTLTAVEKTAGWKLLFDGKTFNGWGCTDPNSKGWVIDDGAIFYNVQGPGYMYTKDRFGDFEFKIDFKVDNGTNSGIFFRWDKLGNPVHTGIEMQVLDSAAANPPGKHDCGAIYDIMAPSENTMKPAGEWNTAIIRCSDDLVTVNLNGKSIIRMDLDQYPTAHKSADGTNNKFDIAYKDMAREGHIGLQSHGGKVWYKNVKIRELK